MRGPLRFVDAVGEEHFAAMSRIHARGWRDTYKDAVPADYLAGTITDDHWTGIFRNNFETQNGIHGLLLYRGETPASCLNYCRARTDNFNSAECRFQNQGFEDWGEIASFYTEPSERGKGYGGLLFEEALRRLREMGFRNAFVFVLRENEKARRFYAAHGFSWNGDVQEIPFPHGTVCCDLRYVRKLSDLPKALPDDLRGVHDGNEGVFVNLADEVPQ